MNSFRVPDSITSHQCDAWSGLSATQYHPLTPQIDGLISSPSYLGHSKSPTSDERNAPKCIDYINRDDYEDAESCESCERICEPCKRESKAVQSALCHYIG